jgi:hypothetical protein
VLQKNSKKCGVEGTERPQYNQVAKGMGPNHKSFFPNISYRLKAKINVTPNFTTVVTGHGNIKSYLYKFKILGIPMCSCTSGEQTVDHILFDCKL